MIDAPAIMVVVGSAIQAAPAVRAIVAGIRPRRPIDELVASLPFTPLPRPAPALDALLERIR